MKGGVNNLLRTISAPSRLETKNNRSNYTNSNSNSNNITKPLFEIYYESLFYTSKIDVTKLEKKRDLITLRKLKPNRIILKNYSPFEEYQCWNIYFYLKSLERDRDKVQISSLKEIKFLIETEDINFFLPESGDLGFRNKNIEEQMKDKKRYKEAKQLLIMNLTSFNINSSNINSNINSNN